MFLVWAEKRQYPVWCRYPGQVLARNLSLHPVTEPEPSAHRQIHLSTSPCPHSVVPQRHVANTPARVVFSHILIAGIWRVAIVRHTLSPCAQKARESRTKVSLPYPFHRNFLTEPHVEWLAYQKQGSVTLASGEGCLGPRVNSWDATQTGKKADHWKTGGAFQAQNFSLNRHMWHCSCHCVLSWLATTTLLWKRQGMRVVLLPRNWYKNTWNHAPEGQMQVPWSALRLDTQERRLPIPLCSDTNLAWVSTHRPV